MTLRSEMMVMRFLQAGMMGVDEAGFKIRKRALTTMMVVSGWVAVKLTLGIGLVD